MSEGACLYAIVDAARDPALHGWVLGCPERVCLFAGKLKPPLDRVAPYLVQLGGGTELARQWQRQGWGASWGILLHSARTLEQLRRHFRRFLQAMLPDGRVVLFRFYDPRVFRVYLATLEPAERAEWFKGIEEYRVETETGDGTLYCRPTDTVEVKRRA